MSGLQLNQDLETCANAVSKQVRVGTPLSTDNPDEISQVFASEETLTDQERRQA